MSKASPSPRFEEQATAGQPLQRLLVERALREASMGAQDVEARFQEVKFRKTTLSPSSQSPDGTPSTDLSQDSTAPPMTSKFCARNATQPNPRGKMLQDAKLKDRINKLLTKDRLRATADAIHRLNSDLFGEDCFVYVPESQALAEADLDKLEKFFEGVKRIRQDLEAEYHFATKALTAGDDA